MKLKKEKIPRIIVTTIATIVIIFGTIAVVAYARGYRFNNRLGLVVKTGVLNIESNPLRTDVYLNGKSKGKTPKTIASIPEGIHQVEITRNGYHTWTKDVEIKYEKSTPIYPHLFLIEPEVEEVFSTEDEVVDILHSQDSNYIFILTRKPLTVEGDLATPEEQDDYLYRVWRYNTNPSFWSAQNNPILVIEQEFTDLIEFNFLLSPTSEYALVKVTSKPSAQTVATADTITHYLLNTDQNNTPEIIDLSGYSDLYEIHWAEDEEYFIAVSEAQIRSYNISSAEDNVIYQPLSTAEPTPPNDDENPEDSDIENDQIIWTTDEESNFYYIEHIQSSEDNPRYMQVQQVPLGGQITSPLIDKIYYSNDDKYLVSQEEFEENEELFIFTNSPEASQFAGKITDFEILDDINMVFIETQFASYLYDIETDKYILVSVIPSKLHSISPDEEKLLLKSEKSVELFIFDKEDADHITKLGAVTILDKNPKRLKWHGASRVIFYSENDRFKSIDIDKDNRFDIADLSGNLFALENSGDNIFTIDEDDGSMKIVRVKIN